MSINNNNQIIQCLDGQEIKLIPIDVKDLEKEQLNDARELAESAILLKSINEDLNKLLVDQSDFLNISDNNVVSAEITLKQANIELKAAAEYKKIKIGPILLGVGVGAALFGLPSAFVVGTYSALFATGGGVLGGLVGRIVS